METFTSRFYGSTFQILYLERERGFISSDKKPAYMTLKQEGQDGLGSLT